MCWSEAGEGASRHGPACRRRAQQAAAAYRHGGMGQQEPQQQRHQQRHQQQHQQRQFFKTFRSSNNHRTHAVSCAVCAAPASGPGSTASTCQKNATHRWHHSQPYPNAPTTHPAPPSSSSPLPGRRRRQPPAAGAAARPATQGRAQRSAATPAPYGETPTGTCSQACTYACTFGELVGSPSELVRSP